MSNEQSDAPHWFTTAVAAPVDIGRVDVAGAEVHYRAWGPTGTPGLVLVHGGAAHSRWWDHVAPMLATGRRVVALDLTGHGDSDRRQEYGLERWAEEALAVAKPAASRARRCWSGTAWAEWCRTWQRNCSARTWPVSS